MSKELYGPTKVGGDILSYCSRCKMELAHVIVSMLDSRPAKVICKTCKSEHKHRLPPGTRAKRKTSTAGRPRVKNTVRAAELWEEKIAASSSKTVPYSIQSSFQSGDLINHSIFGVGVVEDAKDNGKMLVLFRGGEKVLVHGRS